jgi:acylphosphatase
LDGSDYNGAVRRATDDRQARRYLIRGRVQGVGYRWFVQKNAADIGVDGYVRNLDDGRVEVYAIGSPEQLNELSGLLWRGPRMADVRGVDEQYAAPQIVSGFQVSH